MSLGLDLWAGLASAIWIRAQLRAARPSHRLAHLPRAESAPTERLSIVVPSCDESAKTVNSSLQAHLQTPPDVLERIVLVDDRSEAPLCVAADPRLEQLRIDTLPEGWLGKTHALAAGLGAVETPWVLFTDADVALAPRASRDALVFAEAHRLDHLCLIPTYRDRGFWLSSAIEAAQGLLLAGRRAHEVGRTRAAVGLGAFGLYRTSTLRRLGGFDGLELAVLDDMALARRVVDGGGNARVLRAPDHVSLEWYGALEAMVRGLEKTFLAAGGFRPLRTALLSAGLAALTLGPLAGLAFGSGPARMASCVALGALFFSAAIRARQGDTTFARAVAAPLGQLVLAAAGLRAAFVGARSGTLSWRGRAYPLATLRRAAQRTSPASELTSGDDTSPPPG